MHQILGMNCAGVHHIGSTSVPGLPAKADLDVLCMVHDLQASRILEAHGYAFKGELNIPLRFYFSRNTPESKLNLHVTRPDHGFVSLNLAFRDGLRGSPEAREAYGVLKKRLASDPASFQRTDCAQRGCGAGFPLYTLQKNDWIKSFLASQGFRGQTGSFCLHDAEWAAYHALKRREIFARAGLVYDPAHPVMTDPAHYHIVWYAGVRIVGCAHVEHLDDQRAALRALVTDPAEQGHGYGRALLGFVEQWLAVHGFRSLHVHSTPGAAGFYQRLGYTPIPFDDPCIIPDPVDLGRLLAGVVSAGEVWHKGREFPVGQQD